MWDEVTAAEGDPLGTCVRQLPSEAEYDQRMITEWIPLLSFDGREKRGKIRVGIQYIFDQVKLCDGIIQKREEEYQTLTDDLKKTTDVLNATMGTTMNVSIFV